MEELACGGVVSPLESIRAGPDAWSPGAPTRTPHHSHAHNPEVRVGVPDLPASRCCACDYWSRRDSPVILNDLEVSLQV